MIKKFPMIICFLGFLALTGCGKLNFVSGAQVNSFTNQGDDFAQLVVDLNSSGLVLPTVSIPFPDPANPAKEYAVVTLSSSTLGVTVDLSAVAGLPKSGSTPVLPNGTAIPVSQYDPASMLEIAAGNSLSQLYIELNSAKKEALFGTAIVIPEFNIGVPTDLFVPFTTPDGITGTAGVFTGAQAGQSGFAVFVDVSSVLSKLSTAPVVVKQNYQALGLSGPMTGSTLQFQSLSPSYSGMRLLNRRLSYLRNNGVPLHVQ